ncbi:uncharacterized protein ATC70_005387 [Mucor velutinosus]|uniref:Uncharacterized protein n=1 Tax=Mucor velutinosus TaxID=708070 RepID=A0AAN7DB86_9FUNG|nr:hypothetical protein ATC70_005387 [Mucor velutinosus]
MQSQPHVYQQHPGNMPQPGGMLPPQGIPSNSMQFRKRPSEADTLTKHIK